jgi:type III pantothenate kinase
MVVAIDVGNSAVKVALVHRDRVESVRRLATRDGAARHGLARDLGALLAGPGAPEAGEGISLVSVVPSWTDLVTETAATLGFPLLIADHDSIPMEVRLPRPESVGPDRLVSAYAAERMYGAPVIVVDLGTATTVDAVDVDGAFAGGAIAPGIEVGLRGLAGGTALLPRVAPDLPATAIGRDTESAIQSGVMLGHVGAVRELVTRIARELVPGERKRPTVVVTGGFSEAPVARLLLVDGGSGLPPVADALEPYLTLRGLALLNQEVGVLRVSR